ncbi:hypothetical protein BT63DRAFT_419776 [Microthyrium microscopicum]|uniref:DNA-directed RNA polymerase subunit n=1 Tax=Microthyrium microscopicum TaxID=703497 RepID=A0A6A6UQB2_9PEZI|nr:hypothetical protein BT63DRAFT_419776 [Microthyrium microscopicum]
MFFVKELERVFYVHASYLGSGLHNELTKRIHTEIEGMIEDNYFIVCILEDDKFSEGRTIPGGGHIEYTAYMKALCWQPYKREVVDGVVLNLVESGFFCEIGALVVFVSQEHMPKDMFFETQGAGPQWTNNKDMTIERSSSVRVRLLGVKATMNRLTGIATINEDYLGVLANS